MRMRGIIWDNGPEIRCIVWTPWWPWLNALYSVHCTILTGLYRSLFTVSCRFHSGRLILCTAPLPISHNTGRSKKMSHTLNTICPIQVSICNILHLLGNFTWVFCGYWLVMVTVPIVCMDTYCRKVRKERDLTDAQWPGQGISHIFCDKCFIESVSFPFECLSKLWGRVFHMQCNIIEIWWVLYTLVLWSADFTTHRS